MELKQKSQYGAVDFAKFICALLIVTAHYITENAEGRVNVFLEYGVSIYIIVVPFFFACSGYLLFKKILLNPQSESSILKMRLKHLLIMYAGWSAIYILFKLLTWMRFGTSPADVCKYLLNAVFYSTYKTIWFLPALAVAIVMTSFFSKRLGAKRLAAIALAFYLLGALGVSYSFLFVNTTVAQILDVYNYIFASTRNGVFNGFPFVVIGFLIARNEYDKKRASTLKYLIGTILFGILFVAEAFILKLKFDAVNANTLLFLLPFTYCFIRLCLGISWESTPVLIWMRKISTTIFLCQRIFLSALPELFPSSFWAEVLQANPYVGLLYTLCSTLVLSELLLLLSKKSKLISVLC